MPGPFRIEVGWPVPSLWPNARPHWSDKYKASKKAKLEAFWATKTVIPPGHQHDGSRMKLTIEAHPDVTRGRDDDNLVAAMKSARDGIASALNCDDGLFDLQPVTWGGLDRGRGRVVLILESSQ